MSINRKKEVVKKMTVGIIYRAINIDNGQCYIGQTIQELEIRKARHFYDSFDKNTSDYDSHFHRAIRAYAEKDIWIWDIVWSNIPIEDINMWECFFIAFYDSFNEGYNSDTGGENGRIISEDVKNKISKAKKDKPKSEEWKQKMSESKKGENNPMFGRPSPNKGKEHTTEVKKKMSEAKIGNKIWVGRKHTAEAKKKMSESKKGENHPMFGKKRPDVAKRNKQRAKGPKNEHC